MSDSASTIEYREVPDFPGYRVGDDGSFWSCRLRGGAARLHPGPSGEWRQIYPSYDKDGYGRVRLYRGSAQSGTSFGLHTLILLSFVGPRPDRHECRHLNGNRSDNRLANLSWGSVAQNLHDRRLHGTLLGDKNGRSKVTEEDVKTIRRLYAEGNISQKELAKRYALGKSAIQFILNGRNWGWLR